MRREFGTGQVGPDLDDGRSGPVAAPGPEPHSQPGSAAWVAILNDLMSILRWVWRGVGATIVAILALGLCACAPSPGPSGLLVIHWSRQTSAHPPTFKIEGRGVTRVEHTFSTNLRLPTGVYRIVMPGVVCPSPPSSLGGSPGPAPKAVTILVVTVTAQRPALVSDIGPAAGVAACS